MNNKGFPVIVKLLNPSNSNVRQKHRFILLKNTKEKICTFVTGNTKGFAWSRTQFSGKAPVK